MAPALVSFWLCLETLQGKYGRIGKMFSVLMGALGWWSLTYSFELASLNEEGMRFWLKLEYPGVILIAPMTYLIVRSFLGMRRMSWNMKVGIWIVPAVTLVLQVTNGHHGLFYDSIKVTTDGSRSWLELHAGPWYIVDSVYVLLLGLLGLIHLIVRLPPRQEPVARRQADVVIAAVIFPYVGFLLYLSDWPLAPGVDLTTFFSLISGLPQYHQPQILKH